MLPAAPLRRTGAGSTLGTPMWVRISYAGGACVTESLDTLGASIGRRNDPNGEIALHTAATRSHAALPSTARAHSSVSAWYELHRFGRVIGIGTAVGERDPLPANAAHWRQIIGPQNTTIWADLNSEGTFKFSDADFPPIAGWNFFDDDSNPADQRCDSARLRAAISDPQANAESASAESLSRRLADGDVQRMLRHVWCRFPVEWSREDVEMRYGYVRSLEPFLQAPEAWPRFRAHLEALAFTGLPVGYRAATWHVHPVGFIAHMRKCAWLSPAEAVQAMPRSLVAEDHRSRTLYRTTVSLRQAQARIDPIAADLNRVMRKYLIETRQRQACFLATAMVESTLLSQFYEGGRGAGHAYGAWYGRGIIQLTWEAGYLAYFAYRGRATGNPVANVRWRDEVETEPWERCDSAGFWWLNNAANVTCDPETGNVDWPTSTCENFNWHTHTCVGALTRETRPQNDTLARVARHVNTGRPTTTNRVNGLPERQDIFIHAQAVLMEVLYPDTSGALIEVRPRFFRAQR